VRRADVVAGLVLTLFGLVTLFVIIPAQVGGKAGQAGVAPDLFPLTLMALMTGLAALLFATRLWGSGGEEGSAPLKAHNFFFIGTAALALLGSFLAIKHLGFITGGVLTVAAGMLVMEGRRHPLRVVAVSLAAPLAVYGVFRHLFTVLLP